jgi:hypothetical protein
MVHDDLLHRVPITVTGLDEITNRGSIDREYTFIVPGGVKSAPVMTLTIVPSE